jgi:four helix bundle protein
MESPELPPIHELNLLSEIEVVAESRSTYDGEDQRELRGYRRLKVWQTSMDMVAEGYRISALFPKDEMFGLTRQLRKAAVSVSLNIAEGWGRNGKAEFARFSDIASASANEVEAAVEIALRLGYLAQNEVSAFFQLLDRVCAMLYRLIESLRKS